MLITKKNCFYKNYKSPAVKFQCGHCCVLFGLVATTVLLHKSAKYLYNTGKYIKKSWKIHLVAVYCLEYLQHLYYFTRYNAKSAIKYI